MTATFAAYQDKRGRHMIKNWMMFVLAVIPATMAMAQSPDIEAIRKEHPDQTNSLSMKFVYIPPGTFMMGEGPQHQVTISKAYYMQTTEMTQAQWRAVMGKNNSFYGGCDNCPEEQVSWEDVQEFIRKLNQLDPGQGYRLPTEAEWEYACRAGSTGAYCFGDDEGRLGEYGWYEGNETQNETHPVGQKKPNAWGLYDMHGNVWEWCQDWHGPYPASAVTDPRGPSSGSDRVFRGGGFESGARVIYSTMRGGDVPAKRDMCLGFRLVKDDTGRNKAELSHPALAQPPDIEAIRKEYPDQTNSLGMKFVYIPPGTFMMGSNELHAAMEFQHQVTLSKGFYLQTTEVTQSQWQAVMGTTLIQHRSIDVVLPLAGEGPEYPMYHVSWEDTQEFIRKLNTRGEGTYRLPTEAEWEYACRAGTTTAFHYGRQLDATMANFDGNYPFGRAPKGPYRKKTMPVGSFPPNAWGLYDMHGNVEEWCQDWYGDYPRSAVTDPQGPSSGSDRVSRGGGWRDNAIFCRSVDRSHRSSDIGSISQGFRLVREAK